jgi:hypothetical protein
VDHRPKLQKTPNLNSPKQILFTNQRKTPNFPQDKKRQLVTLFSVYLRVLPFSEPLFSKTQILKVPKPAPIPLFLANSHRPIIKGPPPDLILYITRFNVTHILIPSLIQNPFSHKFLKLF